MAALDWDGSELKLGRSLWRRWSASPRDGLRRAPRRWGASCASAGRKRTTPSRTWSPRCAPSCGSKGWILGAKLEWHDDVLRLGPLGMGRQSAGGVNPRNSADVFRVDPLESAGSCDERVLDLLEMRWTNREAAMRECNADVRRLLREAGVSVED